VERLTAEDRLILWPDEVWPQDIGALGVLDGSILLNTDGRFGIENVKQAIEGRLHLLRRFRQVLYVPRRGLGGPLSVDAPAFDLSEHIRVEELAASADEAELLRTVARLRRRQPWTPAAWPSARDLAVANLQRRIGKLSSLKERRAPHSGSAPRMGCHSGAARAPCPEARTQYEPESGHWPRTHTRIDA
jgi:Wax ester synthase-like Acyl-CoA acyltransferase domain